MSAARQPGDERNSASPLRLVAVGLLLVVVIAAAGSESALAGSRRERRSAVAFGVLRTFEVPRARGLGRSTDETPTLTPVPPHAAQPTFTRTAYLDRPVRFVRNSKREVALTFDDGPSRNTQTILRILRAGGAHATFFMVGERAMQNDPAVLAAVMQGEEIADHTWSHRALRHLDATQTATQIDRSQALLAAESGSVPAFVRPRGGKFDEAGRKALASRGLVLALWSIHANDVLQSPPPKKLVTNVTNAAKPGSIILLHETNPNTIMALPKILSGLRAKGLRPVTLSQLLADGHP